MAKLLVTVDVVLFTILDRKLRSAAFLDSILGGGA